MFLYLYCILSQTICIQLSQYAYCDPHMHMGIKINPGMHKGITCLAIPVSPYTYGDQDQSPYAYGDYMTCDPRMHMGIDLDPHMHTGIFVIPVCIRGLFLIPVCIQGSHDIIPVCIQGLHDMRSPFAYGD